MTTPAGTHTPEPVAGYVPLSKLWAQGDTIVRGYQNNPSDFVTPEPTIPVFRGHLTVLLSTEKDVRDRVRGAVEARRVAAEDVRSDIRTSEHYLRRIGGAKPPAQASALYAKANMKTRKAPASKRLDFDVIDGKVQSGARGRIKAPARKYFVEWRCSADQGKTFPFTGFSQRATFDFTGLAVGVEHWFQQRVTIKGVTGDWSQVFKLTIR